MRASSPEVKVVAAVAPGAEGWWTFAHASSRAAAEAGVDALRVSLPTGAATADLQPWIELRKAVLRAQMDFLVTVSRPEEVAFLHAAGVGGFAVSVRDALATPPWDALGRARLPVLLYPDGATLPDLDRAVEGVIRYVDLDLTIMYGSADDPEEPEALGLARLARAAPPRALRGYADRSGTGWPALAACALGADVLELPLALSPFLPGSTGALGPEGLRTTVEGLRYLARARAHEGLL